MAGSKPKSLWQRLWSKVDVRGEDECWPWKASTRNGYAQIGNGKYGVVYAHRLVYEWEYGEIPDNVEVHHRCEDRLCLNPKHLEALPHKIHMQSHAGQRSMPKWLKQLEDRIERLEVALRTEN